MADKPIGKDATGYEILTDAMKALLNQYPGLYENETIKFEELGKESGIAFSADNGALVYLEEEDICGTMHQICQYPFYVVYNLSCGFYFQTERWIDMPRMSKKRKQEWALFLNDRNRITYNELCRKCRNDCKQSFRCVVVHCPKYLSKRRTKNYEND